MAEHGVALVSTFGVLDVGASGANLDRETSDKMKRARSAYLEVLSAARDVGLTIAVGTDLNHADIPRELDGLVAAGYSPMEAIRAATKTGAEICGVEDAGTLVPGKTADLIAVRADPIQDIGALRNVAVVMKQGQLVRGGASEVNGEPPGTPALLELHARG
jgi:imidazolonepropionase-like amidohydrolase